MPKLSPAAVGAFVRPSLFLTAALALLACSGGGQEPGKPDALDARPSPEAAANDTQGGRPDGASDTPNGVPDAPPFDVPPAQNRIPSDIPMQGDTLPDAGPLVFDATMGDGPVVPDTAPPVDIDNCAAAGAPTATPTLMSACAEDGALGYVRDGNIPYVCARGPANAAKPSCLLWRRGSWYLQARGKIWNSNQLDLGRPCTMMGERSGFPGGTFICSEEPKSKTLQWGVMVSDDLLPFVRWDPTETFFTLACRPPADTSNGAQNYRATVDIDANDSNTLYLNIEWIGPFRSRDGGATWAPFNIGGRALPARKTSGAACHGEYPGFAFVPGNTAHIYFLAGGAPGSEITTPHLQGGGLWDSIDGGATFRWLGRPELNQYVSSFARVGDGTTLLWGTSNSLGTATGPKPPTPQTVGLLYRSDDAGTTWRELPTGLWTESSASYLWVNPQKPQHYIVGLFQYLQRLGPSDSRSPGMIESMDGGATWTKVAGVTAAENAFMHENTVISPNGKHIFTCGLGPIRGGPCSRSEDGGATFVSSEAMLGVALDPRDATSQRLIGYRLAGGTPTIPLAGGIVFSSDGGKTWTVTAPLPTERPGAIKFDPNVSGRVYLTGEAGAIFRSNDSGVTWTRLTVYTDFINVARAD